MKPKKEITYKGKKYMIYDCSFSEHCISYILNSGNGWEEDVIEYILSFADKTKTMVDIGGEIGTYTIRLADFFGNIVTFEPNVENFNMLIESIRINNFTNVDVKNSAVGSSFGKCTMTTPYKNIVDLSGDEVSVVPLDSLNIENCQFIKIDVEGHELDVLIGAKKTIENNKPIIYLETHPNIRANIDKECETWLNCRGYYPTRVISNIDKFWEYKPWENENISIRIRRTNRKTDL